MEVTYGNYIMSVSPSSDTHSAAGDSTSLSIKATRDVYHNGEFYTTENCGWSRSGSATGFEVTGASSGTGSGSNTVTSEKNPNTSSRSITLTYTNSSNTSTKATVTITQSENVWTYTFSVSPNSLSWTYNQTTEKSITVTSTKKGTNGDNSTVSWSASDNADWGNISPTSSSSTSATFTPTGSNTGTSNQTGTITFTQSESGKKATVSVSRTPSSETMYQYTFSSNPSSLSFNASGENKSVVITSQRRSLTVIGGTSVSNTGSWSNWSNWESSVSGTGFSKVDNDTAKASQNTSTSARTGTFLFTQTQDNVFSTENPEFMSDPSELNVPLNQKGETYDYVFTVDPDEVEVGWEGETIRINVDSRKVGVSTGASENLAWDYILPKPDWIVQVSPSLSNQTECRATVTENNTGKDRVGELILEQKETSSTAVITVKQESKYFAIFNVQIIDTLSNPVHPQDSDDIWIRCYVDDVDLGKIITTTKYTNESFENSAANSLSIYTYPVGQSYSGTLVVKFRKESSRDITGSKLSKIEKADETGTSGILNTLISDSGTIITITYSFSKPLSSAFQTSLIATFENGRTLSIGNEYFFGTE